MHDFSVWAPDAARVEVLLPAAGAAADDAPRVEAVRAGGGWWSASVADAGHGTDYAFSLDGGPARPDPRSAWLPQGPDGPSRVFDAAAFAWTDEGWAGVDGRGAVFYELHVGTFTAEGTLDAAVGRLDHLVDLGVQVVELLPVAAFPGRWGWGYDGVGLWAVHEPYGGPEALQRFVDACHARGLGVCLDVVYNHLGPAGNYLPEFGPYFTDEHETPWGTAVNLDAPGSREVRAYVVQGALRWLRDFHVDALRLDAVHALVDDSAVHVLAELSLKAAELSDEVGRPLTLVAESDLNDPRTVEPARDGGWGMQAQWADDVHHALHALVTGERQGYYVDFGSVDVLRTTMTGAFLHAGTFSTFRDEVWGRPVDPTLHRGGSFVAYTSNHDQVGNRATGDRPSATLPGGVLATSAALVLLGPFSPMLFMGEEWGARTPWQFFTDFPDPELAAAVREGRRGEFASHGWDAEDVPDPQDAATRDASVLDWAEPTTGRGAALLDWHRRLLALRAAEGDLRDDVLGRSPSLDLVGDEDAGWLVLVRGAFRVVANLGDTAQEVGVQRGGGVEGESGAELVAAYGGEDGDAEVVAEGEVVRLPAHSVAVVRLR
ncbi:malto-oligosyltrehalose trehalohydrolase [Pseudokineococcus lusitanus]|uniref:Malto-oligosyltrehalose trehalohydrolase n=1 Tax=Pseudokineococcus lusitanus TaxID=763993 RepID=A0A3N1G8Q3_9ACTN|nr:malto-oligosyltrehalose trehalohydrolase [Pseudokineococcus lusitanus]ROP26620.1 maltooligosyl trehalose hydrolase [Pseudokineococcus lusitanus]